MAMVMVVDMKNVKKIEREREKKFLKSNIYFQPSNKQPIVQ